MTAKRFSKVCLKAVEELRRLAPKKTGNLAFNAVQYEFINENTFKIYVDDERIAPYMPYTNEEWKSPRWKGKKNPNQDWFNRAAEFIARYVEREVLKDEERKKRAAELRAKKKEAQL